MVNKGDKVKPFNNSIDKNEHLFLSSELNDSISELDDIETIAVFKAKQILHKFIINRLTLTDETYNNVYNCLIFFENCRRFNYYCDTMYTKSILFLKGLIGLIKKIIKKDKIFLILHLEKNIDENDKMKIFYHFCKKIEEKKNLNLLLQEKIQEKLKKIQTNTDVAKIHQEYAEYNYLNTLYCLLLKKKYANKYLLGTFYQWKKNSILLSIIEKSEIKEKLTDNLVNSKIELLKRILSFHLFCNWKIFLFQIKMKLNPKKKFTIFDFELLTNERLICILRGTYKYEKIRNSINKKNLKLTQLNQLKINFYKWRNKAKVCFKRKNKELKNEEKIEEGFDLLFHFINQRIYKLKRIILFQIVKNSKISSNVLQSRILYGMNQIENVFFKKRLLFKHLFFTKLLSKKKHILKGVRSYHKKIYSNNKIMNICNSIFFFFWKKRKELLYLFFTRMKLRSSMPLPDKTSNHLFSFGNSPKNSKEIEVAKFDASSPIPKLFTRNFTFAIKISKLIFQFCLGTFMKKIKIIYKSKKDEKKMKPYQVNKKINENMSIVALSIHHEIANKTKHIKFLKFLLKAVSIFEPKNYLIRLISHNLRYYFNIWNNPVKILIHSIRENKDFQTDLKIKILEYQESITMLENKLLQITLKCEKCKKCSDLLKLSTLSFSTSKKTQAQTQTKSTQAPKLVNAHESDDIEDIDLLDDDLEGGEYYDYLEKTENEIKNNIIQIKTVKDPICEQLKKEVEDLYKEIELLTQLTTH